MSAGKGDAPRPVNTEVYGQNYNDIFRKTQTTESNECKTKNNTGKSDK
jgi:hypothetical protein